MTGKDLKMAFDYLYSTGAVHSQKEFADAIGRAGETISRDFKADKKLSASVPYKLLSAFPNVFNEAWVLRGDGEMLAQKEVKTKEGDKMDVSVTIQILSNTVNILQNELQNVRQELRELKAEVAKLQRAKTGYGTMVAADSAQSYGIDKVK